MSEVKRFRKKPIEVDAIQWTGDNVSDLDEFAGSKFDYNRPTDEAMIFDDLHNSWINVYPNQWIVKGVKGEFYPIADDVLAETYEAA